MLFHRSDVNYFVSRVASHVCIKIILTVMFLIFFGSQLMGIVPIYW